MTHSLPQHHEMVNSELRSQLSQAHKKNYLLAMVLGYISTHLNLHIGINYAASALGMSERTLRRRLRTLELCYQDLVSQVRYEYSTYLLKHTTLSVKRISILTGFKDARSFRRAFVRWSGQLPSSFRQLQLPSLCDCGHSGH